MFRLKYHLPKMMATLSGSFGQISIQPIYLNMIQSPGKYQEGKCNTLESTVFLLVKFMLRWQFYGIQLVTLVIFSNTITSLGSCVKQLKIM